jgi:catechol 2,3-dioxygenase-like lactoylglutathione lyase family enzyme
VRFTWQNTFLDSSRAAGKDWTMTTVQSLAYIGLRAPDLAAWRTFAADLLGMQVVPSSTDDDLFLRLDDRGYRIHVTSGEPGLACLGFEVASPAALAADGRAYDAVTDAGLPIVRSIGMHTNDHMVSFYVKSPSGIDVEFGCQGREIDETTWQVAHYDAISYWGHRPVAAAG